MKARSVFGVEPFRSYRCGMQSIALSPDALELKSKLDVGQRLKGVA